MTNPSTEERAETSQQIDDLKQRGFTVFADGSWLAPANAEPSWPKLPFIFRPSVGADFELYFLDSKDAIAKAKRIEAKHVCDAVGRILWQAEKALKPQRFA